jgi:SsrA-binding protein
MTEPKIPPVAVNRKARFNYAIVDTLEAGIVLKGSEVKSLRAGKAQIGESYATEKDNEIWLINSYIPEYEKARLYTHEPRRPRKLLLHKKQVKKLIGQLRTKGITLVPLSVYFNARGVAKLELALGKGKTHGDKRETVKDREWQREKEAEFKNK